MSNVCTKMNTTNTDGIELANVYNDTKAGVWNVDQKQHLSTFMLVIASNHVETQCVRNECMNK